MSQTPKSHASAPVAPPGVTRERVKALLNQGLSPQRIALALGITTQAVYQHKAKIRQEEGGTAA